MWMRGENVDERRKCGWEEKMWMRGENEDEKRECVCKKENENEKIGWGWKN